jgi:thiol-disulfide isomerase/thioredoxin
MKINSTSALGERVKYPFAYYSKIFAKMNLVLVTFLLFLVNPAGVFAQESLTPVERDVAEFSLVGMDNKEWDAEALSGKLWVVNFWATWCPPCIEEIPSMNKAWDVLEPEGIGMLAINAGEGRVAVEEFLGKIPINFPTLLGNIDSLPNWSVRALPTTLVIDQSGKVIFEALGPREWDNQELLQEIIDLL